MNMGESFHEGEKFMTKVKEVVKNERDWMKLFYIYL